jgi:hypothetical protein
MSVNDLVNRPSQYVAEDGVGELVLGLMLVVTSSAFLERRMLPEGYFGAIVMGAFIGMALAAKTLRNRLTFPRGGYVALDDRVSTPVGRIPGWAWGIIVTFAIGAGLVVISPQQAVFGATFVGALAYSGIKYRRPDILWLAAFCTGLNIWVFERDASMFVVLLWTGAAFALIGGIRLRRFVKSHPKPTETAA